MNESHAEYSYTLYANKSIKHDFLKYEEGVSLFFHQYEKIDQHNIIK